MVAQLSANMFAGSLPTGPAPTEAELRAQYDAAKAASAKRRAEGFLGQVVLPGEQDFESFRALQLTPYGGLGVANTPMPGTELTNVPPMAPSAEMIAADLGPGGMGKRDFGASVGRILADRNTTPEERSRRMYMAPGKPSPRVGPPPPPLYDTPGSASGIEIKGDPNYITDQDISKILGLTPPTQDPDKADFYAFKSTLRDPGDMGRYVAPGEDMSYEDFVKFGRPANLAAAESAGYGGGALLSDGLGNKVSLNGLAGVTPEEALKGGGLLPNSGVSGNLEGTAEAGGILGGTAIAGGGLVPGSGVVGGILPHTPDGPIDPYARPQPGMFPQPVETNPISYDPNAPVDPGFSPNLMGAGRRPVELNPNFNPDAIAGISDQPGAGEMPTKPVSASTGPPVGIPEPDITQRPMPFSGLASLTKLPMFQEFATKLESEHPEASQLFSQMFMGSFQRPMPYQNPFMGMGMGSFYPMMGGMGMGMGGYNPMMGMGGGFNPMMGGMGMGGYSPFMGMNPMMGMGGGFNPMMGMSGGGLGSFYPQPSTYGPPQSMPSIGGYPTPPQSSPFGGAMRGYYA